MSITPTRLIDLDRLGDYHRVIAIPLAKAVTLMEQQILELQESKFGKVEGLEGQVLGFVEDNKLGVVQIKKDGVDRQEVIDIVNSMVDDGTLTKDSVTESTLRVSTFGVEIQNIPVGTSEWKLSDFVDMETRFADTTIYDVNMVLYAWNDSDGLPMTVACQYPNDKILICNHGTKVQGRCVLKTTVIYRELDESTTPSTP